MISNISDIDQETDEALDALGGSFYREGNLPGGFNINTFRSTWRQILANKYGCLWKLEIEGLICGGLGGIVYPCPNDGLLVAQEMFWYVSPDKRGGLDGVRLLKSFETWAITHGARRIQMAHLIGIAPEKMRDFYEARGYKPTEVVYVKEF